MDINQEEVAKRMLVIKAQRSDISKKYKVVDDQLKQEYADLESTFMGSLGDTVDSITIDGYRFSKAIKTRYSISDKKAFIDFVVSNDAYGVINASAVSQPKATALWGDQGAPTFIGTFAQVSLSVVKAAPKKRTFK